MDSFLNHKLKVESYKPQAESSKVLYFIEITRLHCNLLNLRIKIDRIPSILTFHYSTFNYTHHLMLYFCT